MAEATARNFEGDQAKFEGQQLAALNALHATNPDIVDLTAVEAAGIITAETRTKIEAAVPNHQLLFQRAVAKERREASSEVAYRRAFQAIYGRFLLEQGDSDLEKPSGPVMKALRQVLKFPLTSEGLKGRSELRAAVLRLKLAGLSGGNVEELIKEVFATDTSSSARKKLEREHEAAKKRQDNLKAAYVLLSSGTERDKLKASHNRLTTLLAQAGAGGGESFYALKFRLQGEATALERMRPALPSGKRLDSMIAARLAAYKADIEQTINDRWLEFTRTHGGGNDDDKKAIKTAVEEEFRRKVEQEIAKDNRDTEMETGREIAQRRRQYALLEKAEAESRKLHEILETFLDKMRTASKEKIKFKTGGTELDIAVLETQFKAINLDSENFTPQQLLDIFDKLNDFFKDPANIEKLLADFDKRLAKIDDDVSAAKRKVEVAVSEAAQVTNLTDAAAAKKIIAVMVAKQFPEASLEEQQKIAAMVLAGDVATLQTDLEYGALAQRASAELLDTVSQAGFKEKLIGLRYKEGEKTEQPFKDLKPENFKDWASIEKLFTIGRLNHQNGFFVLAALEIFDGDVRSVQSIRTEQKLKKLIAEQLDVDERMDEAGVNKIVNDAFKDQMKKVRPLVATYFGHYDTHAAEWSGYKVKEFNLRYEKLQEERRLGKIGEAVYSKRMAELVKEAQEANVMSQVDFSQDSVMAGYWDSPEAQWLRDRGHDVGKYAGHKALALGKGGLRVAGRALLGTAGLAGSLAVHTALFPFRVAKYPLMLAAKPLVGFMNLFRSSKWQPFSIVGSVRTDLGRVGGYFSGKASGVWTGTQEAVKAVPEELGHAKYEGKKYKDRTTVDMAALEAEAKELKEKAEATPVVIAGSPFIDLKKYKDEVAKLDRILVGSGGGGGSVGGAAKKEAA